MSENMPKVIFLFKIFQIIENIVNGEYSNVEKLKEECKKLVDSIQLVGDKINIDFQPEKVLESF